jgi:TRAP-type C4-dicarboxylate transport system substrate-binding protein
MRRLLSLAALAALALAAAAAPASAFAQNVTIKLGTMAPDGSAWHNLLKEMGEKWSAASGGKVKLKVYAGGTQGNEGDMVRKMQTARQSSPRPSPSSACTTSRPAASAWPPRG